MGRAEWLAHSIGEFSSRQTKPYGADIHDDDARPNPPPPPPPPAVPHPRTPGHPSACVIILLCGPLVVLSCPPPNTLSGTRWAARWKTQTTTYRHQSIRNHESYSLTKNNTRD